MKQKSFLSQLSFLGLFVFILAACGKTPEVSSHPGAGAGAEPAAKSVLKKQEGGNQLSMRLNGVEWIADHDLFGAFHPAGYNKAILIAGSKGPKDKNEQAFNINLFNADGPGTYHIKSGNADLSVTQIANLSPENFMYGSMMGFDLTVKVLKASKADQVIEAQFEGTVTGNAGDTLKVTDGRFIYHE